MATPARQHVVQPLARRPLRPSDAPRGTWLVEFGRYFLREDGKIVAGESPLGPSAFETIWGQILAGRITWYRAP